MAKKILCTLLIFMCILLNSCTKNIEPEDYIKSCVQLEIMGNIYATGFVVNEPCYILTSAHSFKNCYQDNDISILAHINDNTYELSLIAIDNEKDIALLKGDFTVTNYIDLDIQSDNICKFAYVFGNAYGDTIVSSKVQVIETNINVCTDTKNYNGAIFSGDIKLGCSGAPVIGTDGKLLGMVIGKGAHDNTIYALSPTEIKTFLEANI